MENPLSIYQIKTQNLVISAILTLAVFAICFSFFEIRYEVNDDLAMALIAKGYFSGSPDFHLVFINSLIGKLLVFLYSLNPIINWYACLLVFFQLISVFTINYCLLKLDKNKFLLVTAILFPTAYFIINLQFTHVCFLLSFAGILLFLSNKEDSKSLYFLSVIFLFLSSLIRFEMFILTLILSSTFIIKNLKTKNACFALLGLSILIGFARIYDVNSYQNADWKAFNEFNKIRGKVNDNPNVWYNLDGLAKNTKTDELDIILFLKAIYTDKFDTAKITEAYSFVRNNQNTWLGMSNLPEYFDYYGLLEISLLILLALAFYYDKSIGIPIILVNVLLAIILLDATPKPRVMLGAMIMVIILSIISLQKFNVNNKYFLVISLLILSYFSLQISNLVHSDSINVSELQNNKCYVAINPSNVAQGRDTSPFVQSNLESKNIVIGGWLTNSPLMIKQFENFGVSVTPHISLIDNDEINKKCLYIDRNNALTDSLFPHLIKYFKNRGKSIEVVSRSANLVIYQIKKEE